MKAWRKEAQAINTKAGLKHQGRRSKTPFINMGKFPSDLLSALLKRIGLTYNL